VTQFILYFFIFFIFSFVFNFYLVFIYSFGDRGFKMILCPWKVKEILLVRSSCKNFLSSCHGLPNRMCVASIGTTSHKTSFLYFLIEKAMRTCLLTTISPFSLSHWSLYWLDLRHRLWTLTSDLGGPIALMGHVSGP